MPGASDTGIVLAVLGAGISLDRLRRPAFVEHEIVEALSALFVLLSARAHQLVFWDSWEHGRGGTPGFRRAVISPTRSMMKRRSAKRHWSSTRSNRS